MHYGNCKKYSWRQSRFIRGVFNFIDSMVLGIKTLTFSAGFYEEEKELSENEQKKKEKQESLMMAGTVAFSVVAAVAIFMVLPYFLASLMKPVVPPFISSDSDRRLCKNRNLHHIYFTDFRMEDIQRTFISQRRRAQISIISSMGCRLR